MCATVKRDLSFFITGRSSRVNQPGVRKSSIQPISEQRASSRSMRASIVFENPGSGGLIGFTFTRTPRTPARFRRSISASGAFSSMSTMPRHFAIPTSRIASSMHALSRPYALGCTKTKRSTPRCRASFRYSSRGASGGL